MSVSDLVRWFEEREVVLQELEGLISDYNQGNEDGVIAFIFDPEDMLERPAFYERTIYRRNDNWLPAFQQTVERGNGFIAVGLGHLIGERGLVAQLRQRGYTVRRLDSGGNPMP
jgi:hypothetical protein